MTSDVICHSIAIPDKIDFLHDTNQKKNIQEKDIASSWPIYYNLNVDSIFYKQLIVSKNLVRVPSNWKLIVSYIIIEHMCLFFFRLHYMFSWTFPSGFSSKKN